MTLGRQLGAISRASQWWIGDWIRYGNHRWGERYAKAARLTGYDVTSLRNMAWVSSQFDTSLRKDNLTWSHHALLAALPDEEKAHWLQEASTRRLSVADLRLELRAARKGLRSESASQQACDSQSEEKMRCPKCGYSLESSST